ncbi:unnamed protein product [Adineta ricciae]|uniref:Uncharacterized protein n=1 Tax=Adineta ricciae TaxID=249248 RepID=A0A815KYF5_ADIRI|nr:unnamed protein product [Adineta ricciae]CAF1537562.1 unnamed protein product [Adineta ricciae]
MTANSVKVQASQLRRALFLSGTDKNIAGLGQMKGTVVINPDIWLGKPGYQGYLNNRVAVLPEIMQDPGYFTTMSGKWYIWCTAERLPTSRDLGAMSCHDRFRLLLKKTH